MIEFEKPIITKIDENKDYGKFVIEPLERGYGTTLGNSLRRVIFNNNSTQGSFRGSIIND